MAQDDKANTDDKGTNVEDDPGNGGTMYDNNVGKVVEGTGEPDPNALDEEHGDGKGGDKDGKPKDDKGSKDDKSGDKSKSKDGGDDKDGKNTDDADKDKGEFSKDNNFGYVDTTDNVVFSSVISVLVEAEVGRDVAEPIFAEAMKTGDLSKISMPDLEKAAGKATAKMIMNTLEGYQNDQGQKAADNNKMVYDIVGGEEEWAKIAEWSKTAYTQEESDEINKMLDAGGKSAKLAIQDINDKYKKDPKYTVPAKILEGDGGGTAVEGALDRAEYYKLYSEENDRTGGPRLSVLNLLNTRRRSGMKAGI